MNISNDKSLIETVGLVVEKGNSKFKAKLFTIALKDWDNDNFLRFGGDLIYQINEGSRAVNHNSGRRRLIA